jgi:hypothetical protein
MPQRSPAALRDQSRRLAEFCFHGAVGLRFSAVSIGRALSVTVFRSPHNEETDRMTVKLNGPGYKHAKRLIEEGKFIDDDRDAWSDHHPSTQTEKDFIKKSGFSEYGKWFLGVNDEYREESSRHYEFPYGDFENVHRCGILAAQGRAGQDKNFDVENAAADLLAVIDNQARE